MESTIGLYKTELIKPRRPWRSLAQVELATAEWIDWYNPCPMPAQHAGR
jgi:putative transposase